MLFSTRILISRRLRYLPRRLFAVLHHALFQGELTTLRRPVTYSQLLAAKNLGEQCAEVHRTADKYAVREYVCERAGSRYLIPLLQLVERIDDLDLDALAALGTPYVVKAAHGCDMTLLVPDPAAADHAAIRARVAEWLATDYYRAGWREAPYRGLPQRVVVEEMIGDGREAPTDYKFWMFHGEPAMIVVDQDRFRAHTSTMLSPDWREYDITGRFAFAEALPERPENLDEMFDVARKLADGFEFVRIDLYNVDGRVYFGEITHNPGGGLVRLRPRAFDRALGELWRHGTPIPEHFVKR